MTEASSPRHPVASTLLALVWLFPRPSEPAVSLGLENGVELVIGRDEASVVRLVGNDVSRRHAAIRRDGPELVISDLGSRNGVHVNARPVSSSHLASGDVVRLGGWVGVVTATVGEFSELAPGLLGGAVLADALAPLSKAAQSDLPVVLEGETGTGKEVVTRALHAWSARPGPLIAVNCASLPEGPRGSGIVRLPARCIHGSRLAEPRIFPQRGRRHVAARRSFRFADVGPGEVAPRARAARGATARRDADRSHRRADRGRRPGVACRGRSTRDAFGRICSRGSRASRFGFRRSESVARTCSRSFRVS